mgnify:CR=1 FL=1
MLLSSHHCLIPLPHSISPSIMSDQSSHVWALNICSDWGDQEELEGGRNCHGKDMELLCLHGTRFLQPSEPTYSKTASCGIDTPLWLLLLIKSCLPSILLWSTFIWNLNFVLKCVILLAGVTRWPGQVSCFNYLWCKLRLPGTTVTSHQLPGNTRSSGDFLWSLFNQKTTLLPLSRLRCSTSMGFCPRHYRS